MNSDSHHNHCCKPHLPLNKQNPVKKYVQSLGELLPWTASLRQSCVTRLQTTVWERSPQIKSLTALIFTIIHVRRDVFSITSREERKFVVALNWVSQAKQLTWLKPAVLAKLQWTEKRRQLQIFTTNHVRCQSLRCLIAVWVTGCVLFTLIDISGEFQSKKLEIGKMLQKAEMILLLKIPLKGLKKKKIQNEGLRIDGVVCCTDWKAFLGKK